MFQPAENIGRIGHAVDYCTILEKQLAQASRRPDCPLILAKPERKMPDDIEQFIEKYEEGQDA
jgi:hypothetical protein